MKVFISHSWNNKYEVQQMLQELKTLGVEVWIDAEDLLPGMKIQPVIDRELETTDVVVLVWSAQAAASKGVRAEIETCARMEKIIIPFFLDDTALNGVHPYLDGVKGIHPYDFKDGLRTLSVVLVQYMARMMGLSGMDAFEKMKAFRGIIETVGHKIRKEDIKNTGSEAEKDLWEHDVLEINTEAQASLKSDLKVMEAVQALVKQAYDDLVANTNDPAAMKAIVARLKAHPLAQHPAMAQFLPVFEKFGE